MRSVQPGEGALLRRIAVVVHRVVEDGAISVQERDCIRKEKV